MALRISQIATESLQTGDPNVRASQIAVESLQTGNPNVLVSQIAVEVLQTVTPYFSGWWPDYEVIGDRRNRRARGTIDVFDGQQLPFPPPPPPPDFVPSTVGDDHAFRRRREVWARQSIDVFEGQQLPLPPPFILSPDQQFVSGYPYNPYIKKQWDARSRNVSALIEFTEIRPDFAFTDSYADRRRERYKRAVRAREPFYVLAYEQPSTPDPPPVPPGNANKNRPWLHLPAYMSGMQVDTNYLRERRRRRAGERFSAVYAPIKEPTVATPAPTPDQALAWWFRDNTTYRNQRMLRALLWPPRNTVAEVYRASYLAEPIPSYDFAFYDVEDYHSRPIGRYAKSLREAGLFDPGFSQYVPPPTVDVDEWNPTTDRQLRRIIQYRAQQAIAFANDIHEAVPPLAWDFLAVGEERSWTAIRRADFARRYSHVLWPGFFESLFRMVSFDAQMAPFQGELNRVATRNIDAVMRAFSAYLDTIVPTVSSSALTGFVLRVCQDLRGALIRAERQPTVCEEIRGIKAMPTAELQCVTFKKDPTAVKDYFVDWSDRRLLGVNETIATSTWTGGGLTVVKSWVVGKVAYVLLSGGVEDIQYVAGNTITTSLGRTYKREIRVLIVNT